MGVLQDMYIDISTLILPYNSIGHLSTRLLIADREKVLVLELVVKFLSTNKKVRNLIQLGPLIGGGLCHGNSNYYIKFGINGFKSFDL